MTSELPYILLVEDNEDDILLTHRALRRAKLANPIETVRDGAEALDFLWGRGKYADRDPRDLPQLVLLDLNLPKLSGVEVLRRLRAEKLTQSVPVVMLSTSMQQEDVRASYASGANSYVRKPVSSKEFREAVNRLGVYWLAVNVRPPGRN
jgi:two-component system response regulator